MPLRYTGFTPQSMSQQQSQAHVAMGNWCAAFLRSLDQKQHFIFDYRT
jgi:hypothetical protein